MEKQQYGYTSASRQSWHEDSMKTLCADIVKEHPAAAKNEHLLLKLFRQRARDEDEYFDAATQYAVHNTFTNMVRAKEAAERAAYRASPDGQRERYAAQTAAASAAETLKEKVIERVLYLNQIMPNGKKMRFCTGSEMVAMGEAGAKEAAAWIKIGKKAGRKAVGEALSESAVAKLLA